MDVGVDVADHRELTEFVAAFVRHATESADLVTACLKQWHRVLGVDPSQQYPPLFLYELGAILRIAHWQRSDALAPLADEFPPACELLSGLVEQLADNPSMLFGQITVERCPLMSRVVTLWHRNCAWYGMQELGTDLLIKRGNPISALVDLLASYVFAHGNLLTLKGESDVPTDE